MKAIIKQWLIRLLTAWLNKLESDDDAELPMLLRKQAE